MRPDIIKAGDVLRKVAWRTVPAGEGSDGMSKRTDPESTDQGDVMRRATSSPTAA